MTNNAQNSRSPVLSYEFALPTTRKTQQAEYHVFDKILLQIIPKVYLTAGELLLLGTRDL
jgi:hypothetical protein